MQIGAKAEDGAQLCFVRDGAEDAAWSCELSQLSGGQRTLASLSLLLSVSEPLSALHSCHRNLRHYRTHRNKARQPSAIECTLPGLKLHGHHSVSFCSSSMAQLIWKDVLLQASSAAGSRRSQVLLLDEIDAALDETNQQVNACSASHPHTGLCQRQVVESTAAAVLINGSPLHRLPLNFL